MGLLTLHEAIATVLRKNGAPMNSSDIATVVNRDGLYQRKDSKPLQATQVSARIKNYPDMFEKIDGLIALRTINIGLGESTMPIPLDLCPFESLGKLGGLCRAGIPKLDWLSKCGVYAVVTAPDYKPMFVSPEETKETGNVIRPWSQSKLQGKWVKDARVIYIGLAGRHNPRKLEERLKELLRHASGATSTKGPHSGGEIVWQLAGWEDFELYAASTEDPPTPRNTEEELIAKFYDCHKTLPFGNRQK